MRRVSARTVTLALGASVGLALAAGCARRDAADRSADQLRADITKLQADRDRQDQRLGALETAEHDRDLADARKAPSAPAASAEPPRRLPVVRVGESDPPPAPADTIDAQDGADPRPMLSATGTPYGAKRTRSGSRSDGTAVPAFSPEAKRDYDGALALVRSKQYDKALEALTAFLVRYPDHPYAENATYWRGECFYAKGEYARAAEQFEGLMARFPYGNKTADGLLKLGLCQQRLGSQEQAQKTFLDLKDRYPKSDAVRQIPRP